MAFSSAAQSPVDVDNLRSPFTTLTGPVERPGVARCEIDNILCWRRANAASISAVSHGYFFPFKEKEKNVIFRAVVTYRPSSRFALAIDDSKIAEFGWFFLAICHAYYRFSPISLKGKNSAICFVTSYFRVLFLFLLRLPFAYMGEIRYVLFKWQKKVLRRFDILIHCSVSYICDVTASRLEGVRNYFGWRRESWWLAMMKCNFYSSDLY